MDSAKKRALGMPKGRQHWDHPERELILCLQAWWVLTEKTHMIRRSRGPGDPQRDQAAQSQRLLLPCFDREIGFCQGAATTFTATNLVSCPGARSLCAVVCVNPVK